MRPVHPPNQCVLPVVLGRFCVSSPVVPLPWPTSAPACLCRHAQHCVHYRTNRRAHKNPMSGPTTPPRPRDNALASCLSCPQSIKMRPRPSAQSCSWPWPRGLRALIPARSPHRFTFSVITRVRSLEHRLALMGQQCELVTRPLVCRRGSGLPSPSLATARCVCCKGRERGC